ncbi:MAG: hypothetical protein HRT57_14180 [Crocinitomicaceae bacterium]|nr:hypothetical protein [Crocinitomicaceae bacterium]
MKYLITISFLIATGLSFGQGYNDTVAYKTGMIRVGDIIKISGTVIKYEYKSTSGRTMKSSVRVSLLDWYTMDGERDDLLGDFNAVNLGYQDTLYFKSGEVRYARIDKETRIGFQYEFINVNGKISNTSTRKNLLNKVIVGNEDSKIAEDFESPTPRRVYYKK